jgi:hypothetical protein
VLGLAQRPDLVLAAASHRGDRDTKDGKAALNRVAKDAKEAAGSSAASNTGTALHKLTEMIDRGEELGEIPAAFVPDLEAYRRATAPLRMVAIEQFGVLDEYRVAGTWDRIVGYEGELFIADTKSGKSVDFGAMKIAMQLAVYSRSQVYDPVTTTRTPLNVNQERALVIHLPAGTGTCELRWINIAAGWEAVRLAAQVREWRARKDWYRPFVPSVSALISVAASEEELAAIWQANKDAWTPEHTALAIARKAEISVAA